MKTILIVIFAVAFIYSQSEEVVAINDIVNQGNLSEQNIKRIRECIRMHVAKNKRFIVLEPDIAAAMLKEQGVRSGSACSSDECLLKLGKQLYAKKIVGGSLQRTGDVISIDLKMLDVEKNRVISTSSMMAKTSIEELIQAYLPNVIKKLCANAEPIASVEEKPLKTVNARNYSVSSEPAVAGDSKGKNPPATVIESKSGNSTNIITAVGGGLILGAAALILSSQSKSGKNSPSNSEIPLDAPSHNRVP